tara:strand:+ start:752 stop:1144 length:393 start_codon:yes stop_codon:yes gene_type:complete
MHNLPNEQSFTDGDQQDLLDELEVRIDTSVASIREATTNRTHARVELRAGNACDRDAVVSVLQTSEVHATTVTGIANKPIMVGSVFHLQFDQRILDIAPTLAICDRCTMFSDVSFELRLRFTEPVEITSN